ncbi:hypothetical protein OROMI_034066 [Orobanche minor]
MDTFIIVEFALLKFKRKAQAILAVDALNRKLLRCFNKFL